MGAWLEKVAWMQEAETLVVGETTSVLEGNREAWRDKKVQQDHVERSQVV